MKLNAPREVTWWIALIVGVVGIIGSFVTLPVISTIAFWLVVAALALMLVATALKGL